MNKRFCCSCQKATHHREYSSNDASGLERIGFACITLGVTEVLLRSTYFECQECGNTIKE